MNLEFVEDCDLPKWMETYLAAVDKIKLNTVFVKGFSARVDFASTGNQSLISMYLKYVDEIDDLDMIEFDGDDRNPNGFTSVVERIVTGRPNVLIVAYLCRCDLDRFCKSWADRESRIVVVITADVPFDKLGAIAMEGLIPYAARRTVHCIGGGDTVLAEYKQCTDPTIHFYVLPIYRPSKDGKSLESCPLADLKQSANLTILQCA